MSVTVAQGLLHFRAACRLGVDYEALPSKNFTNFRFYDPSAQFLEDEIRKRGEYIHRLRTARWEIHQWANSNFLKDIVEFLTPAKHRVFRELADHHRIEIHQIEHDKVCILLVLRNWINNVHDVEISRIVKALEKCARRIRPNFVRVWKYIVAPSFESGQTHLERFRGIQLYNCLPYLLPKSLTAWLAEKCHVDYSYAFPSMERWPTGAVELFRETLARLLGLRAHARAHTPSLPSPHFSSIPSETASKTHTTHIVSITTQPCVPSIASPVSDRGPPLACAREQPPTSTVRKEESNPSVSNPLYPLEFDRSTSHAVPIRKDADASPFKSTTPTTDEDFERQAEQATTRYARIGLLYAWAAQASNNGNFVPQLMMRRAENWWRVSKRTAKEYAQSVMLMRAEQRAKQQ